MQSPMDQVQRGLKVPLLCLRLRTRRSNTGRKQKQLSSDLQAVRTERQTAIEIRIGLEKRRAR